MYINYPMFRLATAYCISECEHTMCGTSTNMANYTEFPSLAKLVHKHSHIKLYCPANFANIH